jgi:hypothetical protein
VRPSSNFTWASMVQSTASEYSASISMP